MKIKKKQNAINHTKVKNMSYQNILEEETNIQKFFNRIKLT